MEYWDLFFHLYSNQLVKAFKEKYSPNFPKELLDSLSMDIIFKKKLPPPKTNSESNIIDKNSMKISENEDEKKIIEDSKIFDLLDKDKSGDEKLLHNKFSKPLFNKNYDYPPTMFDVMNLRQNNKIDKNNMSFSSLQNIQSSSFANLQNLNTSLPQMNRNYMFNRYNYESSPSNLISNNMIPLGTMKGNPSSNSKKTLLSPPPSMADYSFPSLTKNNNQLFQQNNNESMNSNNNINNNVANTINNLSESKQNYNLANNNQKKTRNSLNNKNLSEKPNNEIQLFNKKRKRYIKNNKLVFI